jgi:glutaredoxin-related protein
MQAFHESTVREVATAVSRDAVVVVGMAKNPFVKKARQALTDAGVAFTYLEYGGYLSEWKPRLAIKMWSGWPTFPMVFVRGKLIGGYDETAKQLADGSLKQRLG